MALDFFYPTSKNAVQKTLSSILLDSATTSDSINLSDVDGIQNKKGVLVINRVDSNGVATPSSREYISFSATSGSTVIIETRNVDGSASAKTHAVGSIVEFIPDAVWAQRMIDQFLVEHNEDGTHNTAGLVTPDGTQTLTNKTLTLPQINDTSSDHLYVMAVNELAADRTVTLPLLAGNDEFVFKDHTQTLTNKTLTAPTIQGTQTGFILCTETLTYDSATTITIASGGASRWKKGDKLKITQTTDKYFYVIGVTDTLLTVTGGSDYTVANAAITAASYCREGTAIGFPDYFNVTVASWATSGTAFTNAPTTPLFRMAVTENRCWLWAIFLTNATSGGTGIFKATITSNQIPNRVDNSLGNAMNVSSTASTGVCYISNTNEISIQKYDATAIAGNSAYFDMSMWYMY